MKTKQELLDFYGVEIGKQYKVTKIYNGVSNAFLYKTFTIKKNSRVMGGIEIKFEDFAVNFLIELLSNFNYKEIKLPILDDKEREYLQHYVMNNPAFKGKVMRIQKKSGLNSFKGYLVIWLDDESIVCFPNFDLAIMYKGMKLDKDYTPKELGLEE